MNRKKNACGIFMIILKLGINSIEIISSQEHIKLPESSRMLSKIHSQILKNTLTQLHMTQLPHRSIKALEEVMLCGVFGFL